MKKRKIRLKTKLIMAAVLAVIIAVVAIFFNNAAAVIISVGSASLRAMNTRAVNEAVEQTLSGGVSYGDIVTVTYNDGGDVSAITADSALVNTIARRTAYLTQSNLTEFSQGGVEVPIGAFTGIEALSGSGATVNVKLIPVVSTECNFVSRFTSAGINQTIHSIYIEVVTDITIVLAARTQQFYATAEVLVCESIIVGKIPQVYLQGGLLGSGSLVPDNR